jgi:hypothetical protein
LDNLYNIFKKISMLSSSLSVAVKASIDQIRALDARSSWMACTNQWSKAGVSWKLISETSNTEPQRKTTKEECRIPTEPDTNPIFVRILVVKDPALAQGTRIIYFKSIGRRLGEDAARSHKGKGESSHVPPINSSIWAMFLCLDTHSTPESNLSPPIQKTEQQKHHLRWKPSG